MKLEEESTGSFRFSMEKWQLALSDAKKLHWIYVNEFFNLAERIEWLSAAIRGNKITIEELEKEGEENGYS